MTTQSKDLKQAFDNLALAFNASSVPGDDLIKSVDALTDAVVAYIATPLTASNLASNSVSTAKIASSAVTATKLASTIQRAYIFTGVDATGAPADATLTGAKVGDVVQAVLNLTDESTATSVFESVITTVDKIKLNSTNLATKKLLVLLLAKGA